MFINSDQRLSTGGVFNTGGGAVVASVRSVVRRKPTR